MIEDITRVYVTVIKNKSAEIPIPIICSQVASNSFIWTNEHRSYENLNQFICVHNIVCHKYEFISSKTGVNTQALESFNNAVKLEVKRRKEAKTELHFAILSLINNL